MGLAAERRAVARRVPAMGIDVGISRVFAQFGRSIRSKLVLAFLLVSLLPTIFIAQLSTYLVASNYDSALERWLTETTVFLADELKDTPDGAKRLADFIAQDQGALATLRAGGPLPAPIHGLTDAFGYSAIVLFDDAGRILFSEPAIKSVQEIPFGDQAPLYRLEVGDHVRYASAGTRRIETASGHETLLLGTWLDQDFLSQMKSVTSLEYRIYYAKHGAYEEIYSAHGPTEPARRPGQAVLAALNQGATHVLDREVDDGQFIGVYTVLPSQSDKPTHAVLFTGVRVTEALRGRPTPPLLFSGIFVVGTILSLGAGVLLSKRLARPLHQLAESVRRLAEGQYGEQVPVQGEDEVAEVATAVNHMSSRLADLRSLEEQLRRRERLAALGQVAAGFAHEVRNPLGIIKTSAEVVRRRTELSQKDADLMGYVIEEVRRIDHLMHEFLTFAKPVPPVLARLLPRQVVDRALAFCSPEFSARSVMVQLDDRAPGAAIMGDENQLFQALLNLILNAIDAMPDGGSLAVSIAREGARVAVRVSDTGAGMAPDVVPHVFDPFFTTKERGVGLGLAKVHALVEAHGGSVACDSAPGRGSMFTLSFPAT